MAFKLYSYYTVDNKRKLIDIIEQIIKLDRIGDHYKLYKYVFKFSFRNQRMCREITTVLKEFKRGSYDVFINRLISSILAGCGSVANDNAINQMIREQWLNFMKITEPILIPFKNIYKSYNFPDTLSISNLLSLHSCFKQVSLLDIYYFTALSRYFNIIIKMLNIFHIITQPLQNEEERVGVSC